MRPIIKISDPNEIYYELPDPNTTFTITYKDSEDDIISQQYTYQEAEQTLDATAERLRQNPFTTLTDDEAKIDELLRSKLAKIYPLSRADLVRNTGYVCNYCGVPVFNGFHVEHTLAKKWYPSDMTNWPNLLFACPSCNSAKGDSPSGIGFDKDTDYIWPDVADDNVHTAIQYKFINNNKATRKNNYKTAKGDVYAQLNLLADMQWLGFSITTYSENGNILIRVPYNQMFVAVILDKTGDGWYTEADRTIHSMFNMNRYAYFSTAGDRRLVERTLTWLWSSKAVVDLHAFENNIATNPNIPKQAITEARTVLLEQIKDSMVVSGFWSVWYTVLDKSTSAMTPANKLSLTNHLESNRFFGTNLSKL